MEFIFKLFEPPPSLQGLVRQSFYAKGRIHYRTDKIVPNGLVPLLFTLGNPHLCGKGETESANEEFNHSWLSGLQTTPLYHTPLDGTHVIGILFEPPGFCDLFGADMTALKDTVVDPRKILPEEFIRLIEHLYSRPDDPVSHTLIFDWLESTDRQGVAPWVFDFHSDIVRNKGDIDIDGWYLRSGHSTRHATNLFRRSTGVTPKILCRIYRLIALLEAIEPAHNVNWTALAHDHGFFDQAHFNHEFRKLTGLFPSEYLSQRRSQLPDLEKGESVSFAPQR